MRMKEEQHIAPWLRTAIVCRQGRSAPQGGGMYSENALVSTKLSYRSALLALRGTDSLARFSGAVRIQERLYGAEWEWGAEVIPKRRAVMSEPGRPIGGRKERLVAVRSALRGSTIGNHSSPSNKTSPAGRSGARRSHSRRRKDFSRVAREWPRGRRRQPSL